MARGWMEPDSSSFLAERIGRADATSLRLGNCLGIPVPRVGPGAQPWALGRNPVGILSLPEFGL
jgi:hypothetical protein